MRIKILIILTITLMLIGGYYFGFFVAAKNISPISKTLITEVGTDIIEKLNYENYVITSNNVDTSKPGVYQVVYRNVDNDLLKTKEVHVIDQKETSYFVKNVIFEQTSSNGTYNVIKSFTRNNNLNVLYSYQTDDVFKHFFNSSMKNGVELSETIRMYSKGDIVDYDTFQNEMVFLGLDENSYNGSKEINLYFKDTTNYEVISLPDIGEVMLTNVELTEKYFVIAGTTKEQNEFFDTKRDNEDSFIILINKQTKQIEKMSMLQLKGNDKINTMICLNNYLYIIQENESNNLKLLKTDLFGNVVKEINLDLKYGYKKPSLKLIDEELYLGFTKYDYEVLDYVDVINKIDDNLNMQLVYYNYNKNYEMKDFVVYNNLYYLLLTNPRSDTGYKYQVADMNKQVIGEYMTNDKVSAHGFGKFNEIITTSQNNKSLIYYQIDSLIKIKEPDLTLTHLNESNLDDYIYLINGNAVRKSDKSSSDVNVNLFGQYQINYYFEDVFDYYVEKTCTVLPFVGVEDNKIYDKGVTIYGNGTLFINDEEVQIPYQVNETGHFDIKLLGKDNQAVCYSIDVENLSVDFTHEENIDKLKLEVKDPNLKYDEQLQIEFNENKMIDNSKRTSPFYYLLPVITLGIVFIFIKRV